MLEIKVFFVGSKYLLPGVKSSSKTKYLVANIDDLKTVQVPAMSDL